MNTPQHSGPLAHHDHDHGHGGGCGGGGGGGGCGGKGHCKSGHQHEQDHGHAHEHAKAHSHGGGCCGGGGGGGGGGCGHHHHHEEAHEEAHDHAGAGGCCGGGGGGGCGCSGGKAESEQIHIFSRKQIRDLDRLAVEEFGMPSILLMENAARGVSGVIMEGLQGVETPAVLLICGPGNNGGDGLAVARHLANRDVIVAIVLAVPESKLTGDSATNLAIAKKMGLPIFDGSSDPQAAIRQACSRIGDPLVVADSLLGTGTDRPATGVFADLIKQMNGMKAAGATLVAIDVPSGLDCDTGLPAADATGSGPAVEADLTIALAGVKAGYLGTQAVENVGELVVVDIGAPRQLIARLGRPLTHSH